MFFTCFTSRLTRENPRPFGCTNRSRVGAPLWYSCRKSLSCCSTNTMHPISHTAHTSCNVLICIQRCLSRVAHLRKLISGVVAPGEVLLHDRNVLILNAFCQWTPRWVSVACLRVRGGTGKSLPPLSRIQSFPHWELFFLTILLLIKNICLLSCPASAVSSPSISAKSNFGLHTKLLSAVFGVVTLFISCCFALGDMDSHLASSHCSYQHTTLSLLKELDCLSVKLKVVSERLWLAPGYC